jgi:hypothetical protein
MRAGAISLSLIGVVGALGLQRPLGGPTQQQDTPTTLPLRILTHNVRYAAKSPSGNEKPWADRRSLIINQFGME